MIREMKNIITTGAVPQRLESLVINLQRMQYIVIIVSRREWVFKEVYKVIVKSRQRRLENKEPVPDWGDYVTVFDTQRCQGQLKNISNCDIKKWENSYGLVRAEPKEENISDECDIKISQVPKQDIYSMSFVYMKLMKIFSCSRCLKTVEQLITLESNNSTISVCIDCNDIIVKKYNLCNLSEE